MTLRRFALGVKLTAKASAYAFHCAENRTEKLLAAVAGGPFIFLENGRNVRLLRRNFFVYPTRFFLHERKEAKFSRGKHFT